MPLDPNSYCPCGTGKKVKHCCNDLLGELQKIDRMLEGGQHVSCLQHIDEQLQKHPDRACFLSLKTMLLRGTNDVEGATLTAARFVEKHPENPTALAESAMMTAIQHQGPAAVKKLQRAISVSQGQIQGRVYEAMGIVAEVLLQQGEWLSGRALLQLQTAIVHDDERPVTVLIELNRSPSVPLLVKADPPLAPCPDDVPWKDRFDGAMQPLQSGDWLTTAKNLTELAGDVDDSPAIWRNLATLRGWLADKSGHVEALRKLASMDIPQEDAVEAEALAMICGEDPLGDRIELVNLTWTIADFEQFQAALSLDRRAMQIPLDPSMFESTDEPPPKMGCLLMDRPAATTAEDVTLADIPRVIGQAMVYGRQTDREARLEVVGVTADELQSLKTVLGQIAGDALADDLKQEVVGHVSASQNLMQQKWRPPEDMTEPQYRALSVEHIRDAFLERWPQLKMAIFDGKSAREVADQPDRRVKLLAAIMVLQTWQAQAASEFDFDELRAQLQLPIDEPIDPKQTPVESVSLARLSRVMVEQTDDDALRSLFQRAAAFGATAALRKFALALVDRASMAGSEEQAMAYAMLAQTDKDPERAIHYVEAGRQATLAAGRSCATWDLMELQYRYARRESEELTRLIDHVQNEHLQEQGVAERLTEWLVQIGAIRPDGSPGGQPPQQAAPGEMPPGQLGPEGPGPGQADAEPADAQPEKLWTPDSQESAGPKKKLWTPD